MIPEIPSRAGSIDALRNDVYRFAAMPNTSREKQRRLRWLVRLEGDRFDLEGFPRGCSREDLFTVEDDGRFFMTGPALDRFSDPAAVWGEAVRAVDAFHAVTGLLWPSLRKPVVGAVYREEEGGCRVLSYAPVAP